MLERLTCAVIPAKRSASRNLEGFAGNGLHSIKHGLDSRFAGMSHVVSSANWATAAGCRSHFQFWAWKREFALARLRRASFMATRVRRCSHFLSVPRSCTRAKARSLKVRASSRFPSRCS
jgi:hypothetical protein